MLIVIAIVVIFATTAGHSCRQRFLGDGIEFELYSAPKLLGNYLDYFKLTHLDANSKKWSKITELGEGTEEYRAALALLFHLDGEELYKAGAIQKISATFNSKNVTNFSNQRDIIMNRISTSPNLFAKSDWKRKEDRPNLREWVLQNFSERCQVP